MLVELSLRWGHTDHWSYHAEFTDAECREDPAAIAMAVWRESPANAKAAFRQWAGAYIEQLERIHPRCRASNFAATSTRTSRQAVIHRDAGEDARHHHALPAARLPELTGVTIRTTLPNDGSTPPFAC
jgi:hypothetical protein